VNCLDAETLAAWFDGGLSGAALEDVQSHVAGCARCQALVGTLGLTRAAVPTTESERPARWWLAWAVPAAAAATAIAVWVAVPRPTNVGVNPPSSLQKQETTAPQSAALPPEAETAAPPARPATPTLQDRKASADASSRAARESSNDVAQQPPGKLDELVSIAPAAPAAERREQDQRGGAVTGQLQAKAAFATNLCGPMWPAPPADVAARITAGSASSADVCWIVGRAGTVLRSTDRQTWQRITLPVAVDLSSVNATDARSATVVTADGRTFSTVDGGMTWTQP
jgi:hypothetical protein